MTSNVDVDTQIQHSSKKDDRCESRLNDKISLDDVVNIWW